MGITGGRGKKGGSMMTVSAGYKVHLNSFSAL